MIVGIIKTCVLYRGHAAMPEERSVDNFSIDHHPNPAAHSILVIEIHHRHVDRVGHFNGCGNPSFRQVSHGGRSEQQQWRCQAEHASSLSGEVVDQAALRVKQSVGTKVKECACEHYCVAALMALATRSASA
jgi:hypothetical protein